MLREAVLVPGRVKLLAPVPCRATEAFATGGRRLLRLDGRLRRRRFALYMCVALGVGVPALWIAWSPGQSGRSQTLLVICGLILCGIALFEAVRWALCPSSLTIICDDDVLILECALLTNRTESWPCSKIALTRAELSVWASKGVVWRGHCVRLQTPGQEIVLAATSNESDTIELSERYESILNCAVEQGARVWAWGDVRVMPRP